MMGGTLAERLARCSVSQVLTFEEYQDTCKPGSAGVIGPGIFIGEDKEAEAWLKQLLF